MHIVDAQSPLRVEYTDRIGDPPSTNTTFNSAYRPQEMLTAQVAETMAATINALGSGPVSGMKLGFTISTGDIADSCQHNELRWQIDILDGGHEIVADSGKRGTWEGVQGDDPDWYDVHYWHPDGTPAGKPADLPKTTWGYPTVPGLMAAATRPFTSTGIGMPWYVTFGNHDGEIQGNISPNIPRLREIAVGDQKVWDPPPGMSAVSFLASFIATGKIPDGTRIRTVTADPARQVLTHKQFIQDHFTTTGTPVGHGFTQANIDSDTGYYTFNPVPQIRAISLDTVNPNGGADGSLDATQFSWLAAQLERGPHRQEAGRRLQPPHDHHDGEREGVRSEDRAAAGDGRPGQRAVAGIPERHRLGERAYARQQHLGPPEAGRQRRLLGDQYRISHRLAVAVPADRSGRQPGRDPVDLHDDAGFRGPGARLQQRLARPLRSRPWPASWPPTTGRTAPVTPLPSTAGAARPPTATPS